MRKSKRSFAIPREILEQIGSHGKFIFIIADSNVVYGIYEKAELMDKNKLSSRVKDLVDSGYEGEFWVKIRGEKCIVYTEKPLKEGKMALDNNTFEWEVEKAAA